MYKIFHIIASVQLGGTEIVAIELANHCAGVDGKRHESTIIELYPTNNEYSRAKKEELSKKEIRTITLHDGSKRQSLVLFPIKLARLINREKPDIIHSHTDLPDFALAEALRILKLFNENPRKIVRTIHNTQLWRTHSRLGKYTESTFALDETLPDDWPLRFHLNDELKLTGIFEQIKNRTIDMDMLKEKAYNFATENFSLEKMVGSYSALHQEYHGQ